MSGPEIIILGLFFNLFLINSFANSVEEKNTISLAVFKNSEKHIKTFSTIPDSDQKEEKLTVKKGANPFNWNMQYTDAEKVKRIILWRASLKGPKGFPEAYKVKFRKNGIYFRANF